MKTTLNLNDQVLRQAKGRAAKDGVTLTKFVEDAPRAKLTSKSSGARFKLQLPAIKEVLKRLPDDMTPWHIAFWFRSGNGWLDGKSPEEALGDEDGVLNAADRLREPAVG